MVEAQHDIGVIGMAVMGRNLAMNIAEKGFSCAVFNRTTSRMDDAVKDAKGQGLTLHGYPEIKDFVSSLKKPRKIIMLVKAGPAVEATLLQILGLVEENDIIIDGGNEQYSNTERRIEMAAKEKIRYLGMGVSGGEEGARFGPSLMPGGSQEVYRELAPILTKIAAQVDGKACVAFMGERAAGNYVKMVHNGIEYGDMQLIAEASDILKNLLHQDNKTIANTFQKWNTSYLSSYLIEITCKVFLAPHPDDSTKQLIDDVVDSAGSKGTGKWTSQEAAEKGVPCPTIQAALDSRYLSSFLNLRKSTAQTYGSRSADVKGIEMPTLEEIEGALYCSKICSYAQGLMLLKVASEQHKYGINLASVASIWVGGCIIRAEFLKDISAAYTKNPQLENLLLDDFFATMLKKHQAGWRKTVMAAMAHGIPVPAFAASLNYFDALRAGKLPLNVVQAQRDCFGAHTFARPGHDGMFHADWDNGKWAEQD